jgi:hypothetical protein
MTILTSKMNDKPEWYEDIERASLQARQHQRATDAPPHWLRCDFFLGSRSLLSPYSGRCRKARGHSGEHALSKFDPEV